MLPKVLKNFNLFIDGRGYAGRIEEVTLPKLVNRTEEFSLGGLVMPVQVDMGLEKLECDFILSEYDADVIKLFGINDNSNVPMEFRGAPMLGNASGEKTQLILRGGLSDELNNKVVPVVIVIQGDVIELDLGQWKSGENASLKARLALSYYRLKIDSEDLIEIDIDNELRKVGGRNQASTASFF